ncbi:MAG: hypothetical protein AB1649_26820 [Chloroflexota bacterium]
MGFLQKLFSGPARPSSNLYNFSVKCNRCGETIEGRINLANDLSADYEGDREILHVRKVLMGGGRCFQQIEVQMKFDTNRQLIEKEIQGGKFVD